MQCGTASCYYALTQQFIWFTADTLLGILLGEQAELLPGDAEIEGVVGVSLRAVEGMDKSVRRVLGSDTSAISTLRCLKLYLERLGSDFQNASELQRIAGEQCSLLACLLDQPMAAWCAQQYLLQLHSGLLRWQAVPIWVAVYRAQQHLLDQPMAALAWTATPAATARPLAQLTSTLQLWVAFHKSWQGVKPLLTPKS